MCVPANHTVTLSVGVESAAILEYQWFTNNNSVINEVGDIQAFLHLLVPFLRASEARPGCFLHCCRSLAAPEQTWPSEPRTLGCMCAESMTSWGNMCLATGSKWRCWTSTKPVCWTVNCVASPSETVCWCRCWPVSPPSSALPLDWQGEPHIAINPKAQSVQKGEQVTLRCAAFGIPAPHYQWHRNGQQLPTGSVDTLQVSGLQ